jgi:hypothetical protein
MTNRKLVFAAQAAQSLQELRAAPSKAGLLKQVEKTLGLIETNVRHPSLHTHKYELLNGPGGETVFEAYAQNKTPGAYRVFFFYGPDRMEGRNRIAVVTILAITPHP